MSPLICHLMQLHQGLMNELPPFEWTHWNGSPFHNAGHMKAQCCCIQFHSTDKHGILLCRIILVKHIEVHTNQLWSYSLLKAKICHFTMSLLGTGYCTANTQPSSCAAIWIACPRCACCSQWILCSVGPGTGPYHMHDRVIEVSARK